MPAGGGGGGEVYISDEEEMVNIAPDEEVEVIKGPRQVNRTAYENYQQMAIYN